MFLSDLLLAGSVFNNFTVQAIMIYIILYTNQEEICIIVYSGIK